MTAETDLPDHAKDAGTVLAQLGVSHSGLSTSEANRRLLESGPNRLPQAPAPSAFFRFLQQFNNLLILILIGAAVITGLLGHWLDTVVILAVVMVNTLLGFVQEGRAEKAIAAIHDMLAPEATVIRDGERITVAAETLVPGDIVLLEAGDRVPADLRLLVVNVLSTQEAALTGESLPVEKRTAPVPALAAIGDRSCMAFSGTLVASGQGQGVVTATGAQTELGRISHLLTDLEPLSTPLLRQISQLSRWLTGIILVAASLILAWGYFVRELPFAELFVIVVGLSVASIPEGLPAVLTVTLAIGVQVMAKRHAIVRRLPAIETLGAVSVICSDKTGTLTRNEMMVASVALGDGLLEVSGSGYEPVGEFRRDHAIILVSEMPALQWLARAALLCNDAVLKHVDDDWKVLGDPMEGALISFAIKAGLKPDSDQDHWSRRASLPFDVSHRYMATRHKQAILVKGAPERLLDMCTMQMLPDGSLADIDASQWHQLADTIAAQGQRVLAFAMKPVVEDADASGLAHSDVASGLILLGLTGLIDPPRPEAIAAVAECYRAGIAVKMITGDHAGTAAAIGRQIGLAHTERVLTGADIEPMDQTELARAVLEVDVFARTSPEHKLRLVEALQSHGKVVAMTGDGVNDAPALKRADAGIAMGNKGSAAAREASQLVLLDDNFASIVSAVAAGRTVYDNLRKVISFLLPINGGESLSLVIAILFGLTLPITAPQILWVNMVSSVALALVLAFEAMEPDVMCRPPRRANESMLSGRLLWRIALVSLLFTAGVFGQFMLAQWQGTDVETARTMAVNTLVAMEVFYLFSVRYSHGTSMTIKGVLGTPAVLISIVLVGIFQFVFTYTPWLQVAFESRPLTLIQGLQVISFGVLVLLVIELDKWRERQMS